MKMLVNGLKRMDINNNQNLIKVLKSGGIVVMPTDTIYGILCSAFSSKSIEKIYRIRKRDKSKPCIILIANKEELKKFKIKLTKIQGKEISKKRKGATTFILESNSRELFYLHRGSNSLAFRIPKEKNLRDLLLKTGPLIAPSANIEGEKSAININEAKKYFGNKVDLYIDGGDIIGKASHIIKLGKDGKGISLR